MASYTPIVNKLRGIVKVRSKSPPISLQTLIDRVKRAAFVDELAKISAVSEEEALEAAKTLTEARGKARRYAGAGLIGGITKPLIGITGEAVKGFAERGGGLKGTLGAIRGTTRGTIAKDIVTGGAGGAVIQGIREGMKIRQAKKTYQQFMQGA